MESLFILVASFKMLKAMKKLIYSLLLTLTTVSLAISGPAITRKTLELPEFTGIYVNSGYTVYLKQSNKQEVAVEVLSEIFEISEFKVDKGILHINVARKPKNSNESIWSKIEDVKIAPTMNVYISMKDISALQVNGSGSIISENSIAATHLDLALSGSGDMELDVKGRELTTLVSGSGTLALKGYANTNEILVSGAGKLNAFDCEVNDAFVTLSGSGLCEIHVTEELEATVQGSGTVKHKGNTKSVLKKEYGKGAVERAY